MLAFLPIKVNPEIKLYEVNLDVGEFPQNIACMNGKNAIVDASHT
jgi:hypothetical protein